MTCECLPVVSGYEIDEDTCTQPEWIAVGGKSRCEVKPPLHFRQHQHYKSLPAQSTPVAQTIATPSLVVKLPIAMISHARPPPLEKELLTDTDMVDSDPSPRARSSHYVGLNDKIAAVAIYEDPIELLRDPPYVKEPDLTTHSWTRGAASEKSIEDYPKAVLRAFYGGNTFQCEFHTTITKVCCISCLFESRLVKYIYFFLLAAGRINSRNPSRRATSS
jgi:hypothetical protein